MKLHWQQDFKHRAFSDLLSSRMALDLMSACRQK